MNKNLLVSIITVTFNCRQYIEEAIRSVAIQTYPFIEYLVIDGLSSDGTCEILEKHRNDISDLVIEKDNGIYNAMNKGFSRSTGDVVFFLNADDRFCDNRVVEDFMHVFTEDPDIELVYGDVVLDYPGGMRTWHQNRKMNRRNLARRTISHQSIFARRELLQQTGGFSEKFRVVSDYLWLLELVHKGVRHRYLPRNVTRVCTDGLSHTSEWEHERLSAMRKYYTPAEIFFWRTVPFHFKASSRKLKKFLFELRGYFGNA